MKIVATLFICLALSLCHTRACARVKLPRIFRDSMILQRDAKINIWGWASNGEKISVKFNGRVYKTTTGNNGKWMLQLAPAQAGGPYTMQIAGSNKIILRDILIGDVWLCAGQSNMEHQMKLHAVRYAAEIATADNKYIRQFKVPNTANLLAAQQDLNDGYWKWADSSNVKDFSAVAYFFAKALYEKYKVPVGIINASWGGIPIEAMMSEKSLEEFPGILGTVEKNKDTIYVNNTNRKAFEIIQSTPKPVDRGITEKWYEPSYIPKNWRQIAVPGYWEDQGIRDLDGALWFRKEVDLDHPDFAPAKVFLGRIVDADELYINGVKIGATGYMYPQRRYPVPAGILKKGKNLFVVRITNNYGKGGFVPDKPYQLIVGKDTVDLTGYWQYKVGYVKPANTLPAPFTIAMQNQPTALFNAMIAPLTGYNVKGFAWYQGESNTGRSAEYASLQAAMIRDWRSKWGDNSLPFLFVQLPGFMDYTYSPVESGWALFREAQAGSLTLPNTAMAVTIDLGEWNDIHPDRKKEVGDRLALAAQKIAYDEAIVFTGPTFAAQTISGNKIIVSFNNTGSGLATSNGEALSEFAIAGDDKKFVSANAVIEGNHVIVSIEIIQHPKYVRYAWADNPPNPNLINKEGLPAAPFRTDQ
ncbi:sialate O-acetylesterase [Panacibacter sp. DH6]|uniref:Sialate O-acetylesterase n=1 Tax=Panacibacter microcysteis TaxID=2793269 RepID=A0A931EB43_9BACT|nr:sialate O-acetylesterase [Panacibacter microcysteis]MBG9377206.1 sialate O-acetylesterase [Panacibacter microcysteis]